MLSIRSEVPAGSFPYQAERRNDQHVLGQSEGQARGANELLTVPINFDYNFAAF